MDALADGRLPRPLVFTNGVFDILHRGHVTYLDAAPSWALRWWWPSIRMRPVRRLGKGPERPLNKQEDRAAMLAALACVDAVTAFDEDTPEA